VVAVVEAMAAPRWLRRRRLEAVPSMPGELGRT
jgi:hypothetical protein